MLKTRARMMTTGVIAAIFFAYSFSGAVAAWDAKEKATKVTKTRVAKIEQQIEGVAK